MKIKEITIYGFGRWIDQTFSFSNSNMITLLGDNESGKTTLHQFILYMLFGMTKKKCDFYRPKTSSKLGGRMIIDHPCEGTIWIERLDAAQVQYFADDGEERDEAWFRELLGNMNAEAFQSIYSFSSQDLAVFQNMKESDINELLLSIGLTGSAAVYKVEKKLQSELQKQFKPSGTKPVINEKLSELRAMDQQLGESKRLEKSYKDQIEQIDTLEKKHKLKKEQIAQKNEQLAKEQLMEKILPIRKEIHHVSEELQGLADVRNFPLDNQEQIKTLHIDINNLNREFASQQDTLDTYTKKKQDLEIASLQNEEKEQLNHLLNQKAEITLIRERQRTIEQDYSYKAREITEMIQEKQIHITTDELERQELPFYLEKEWGSLRKEQENIQEKLAGNVQKNEQLLQEKSRMEEEQKNLNQELLAEAHIKELNQRIDAYKQKNRADESQQKNMSQILNKMIREKKKQGRMLVIIGAVIALAGALTGFAADVPWLYLISLAVVAGVYYFRLVQLQDIKELNQQRKGLQPEYPGQEIDVTEAEYQEAKEILEEQQKLQRRLHSLEDRLQHIRSQFEENEAVRFDLTKQQNRLEENIVDQQNHFSVLQDVDVLYWQDIYHLLQKLIQLTNEKQSLKKELDRVTERIYEFSDQVKNWFRTNGLANQTTLEEMMLTLEDIQQQEQQHQHELQQLTQFIKDVQNKLMVLKQKRNRYTEERDKLLKASGTESEEIYFEKQTRKERYNKLYERLEELKERLQILIPEEWQQELADEPLEAENYYKNRKELELALADYEEDLERLKNELAEQRLRIEQLESEEDISLQMHQLAMEKEELEDLVRNWAVQKTALRMLEAAKNQFKDKYLALVIETAQIYFKEITANQYDTIYAPAAEKSFQVENSKKKQRFYVEELSQGTKDQLYISLRFAINEVMAKSSGLPFFMDDAFVHFDMNRTERMHKVLERLAEEQQVILFTCRRELAEAANGDIIHLSI